MKVFYTTLVPVKKLMGTRVDLKKLTALIHSQSLLSEKQQSSLVNFFLYSVPLAMFDEHVGEDTKVTMVKNRTQLIFYP